MKKSHDFFHLECQKKFPKRGNWSLTDIADSTQLGSPARLAAKRGMICVARRRLEQQLQECRVREEELQRKVKELQAQVDDANGRADASHRRAGELQTQVQGAEDTHLVQFELPLLQMLPHPTLMNRTWTEFSVKFFQLRPSGRSLDSNWEFILEI